MCAVHFCTFCLCRYSPVWPQFLLPTSAPSSSAATSLPTQSSLFSTTYHLWYVCMYIHMYAKLLYYVQSLNDLHISLLCSFCIWPPSNVLHDDRKSVCKGALFFLFWTIPQVLQLTVVLLQTNTELRELIRNILHYISLFHPGYGWEKPTTTRKPSVWCKSTVTSFEVENEQIV